MSRYYKLQVNDFIWTNQVDGKAVANAQTIEFDIYANTFSNFAAQSMVRVWGVTKDQISQASDVNGQTVSLFAGMQPGLPLATAASVYSGLIMKGTVFQGFGNWMGVNMTLDMYVNSDAGATQAAPANLAFLWQKGQQLGSIIQTVLQIGYPGYKVNLAISPNLVLQQDEPGVYGTIQQLSRYVQNVSQQINKDPTYQGVQISLTNGVFNVFDGTQPNSSDAIAIQYQDLLGQVTWLGTNIIQFTTRVRADLQLGSTVTLPTLAGMQAITTQQSFSNYRVKNAFSGTWQIKSMRHVGNSRASGAQSWVTTFQAFSNTATGVQTSISESAA